MTSSPSTHATRPDSGLQDAHLNGILMRRAARLAVVIAALLAAAKLFAWLYTDSVAILASLADSALDMAMSLMTFFAVREALRPADAEHRFGHGKLEALAGLGQAAFVAGSALFLLLEASARLLNPRPVEHLGAGLGVMLLSIALSLALVLYQRSVVRRTGSLAISGDQLHYMSDLLSNAAVIAGLLCSAMLGWHWADPAFALLVVLILVTAAWSIASNSLKQLMDHELPDDARARITQIACSHPHVEGVHDLRTRESGQMRFVQLHLEMDGNMTLNLAHTISVEVQNDLEKAFPGSEVIIHQDPLNPDVETSRPPITAGLTP